MWGFEQVDLYMLTSPASAPTDHDQQKTTVPSAASATPPLRAPQPAPSHLIPDSDSASSTQRQHRLQALRLEGWLSELTLLLLG